MERFTYLGTNSGSNLHTIGSCGEMCKHDLNIVAAAVAGAIVLKRCDLMGDLRLGKDVCVCSLYSNGNVRKPCLYP